MKFYWATWKGDLLCIVDGYELEIKDGRVWSISYKKDPIATGRCSSFLQGKILVEALVNAHRVLTQGV